MDGLDVERFAGHLRTGLAVDCVAGVCGDVVPYPQRFDGACAGGGRRGAGGEMELWAETVQCVEGCGRQAGPHLSLAGDGESGTQRCHCV